MVQGSWSNQAARPSAGFREESSYYYLNTVSLERAAHHLLHKTKNEFHRLYLILFDIITHPSDIHLAIGIASLGKTEVHGFIQIRLMYLAACQLIIIRHLILLENRTLEQIHQQFRHLILRLLCHKINSFQHAIF